MAHLRQLSWWKFVCFGGWNCSNDVEVPLFVSQMEHKNSSIHSVFFRNVTYLEALEILIFNRNFRWFKKWFILFSSFYSIFVNYLDITFSKFIFVLTGKRSHLNMPCSGAPHLIEHDSIGQSAGISTVTVTHCN